VRPLRRFAAGFGGAHLTLLGNSVPIFWLGLLMLALFYAKLQWSAGPGRLDDIYQYTVEPRTGFALIDTWLSGDREAFKNAISHLVLPVLCWPITRWRASPA
jgi:peptide/nickel transport system permease protein